MGGWPPSLGIHGTPAGGAGIHGCLEVGCSVVALCFDEFHRTHLKKFFLERAVEAMVTGTTLVFKEEALQARPVQLKLTPKLGGTSEGSRIEGIPSAASAQTSEFHLI